MAKMNEQIKNLPIGVFDSGLGGLTVVREMRKRLPSERIIYLGDSARVPYGTRSAETVIRYAEKCSEFLHGKGLKMLAVACNTASAVALPSLRSASVVPVLGVITAGAKAAIAANAARVGIIGTTGTINSGAYPSEIASLNPECEVHQRPAPLFVPLAEEGWIDGDVPLLAAAKYLEPLVAANVEILLLGCTHYPLLRGPIEQALQNLGSSAAVIDSATAMTFDIEHELDRQGMRRASDKEGSLRCYVTDLPASFEEVASRFLGDRPSEVEVVDIS